MRLICLILSLHVFIFASCSSLRQAPAVNERIRLTDSSLSMLNGQYKTDAWGSGSSRQSLTWDLFDVGYNPRTGHHFVELQYTGDRTIRATYWDSLTLEKSRVFKGRVKEGYFQLRRLYRIYPFLLMNLFRARSYRIGILPNGNLITDYKQISTGTFWVLIPELSRDKAFGVEFERINKGGDKSQTTTR